MLNATKIIPFQITLANTFFKRFIGLMLRRDPIMNEGLWIIPCNSIHMFFMSFPLDIVFLNDQNQVIKLYRNLRPWRLTHLVKNAHSVLELPTGSIDELKIIEGDIIQCPLEVRG